MSRVNYVAGLSVLFLVLSALNTNADQGRVPAGPGAFYGSLSSGYVHSTGPDTSGHGADADDLFFKVDDGGFVGASLGYVFEDTVPNFMPGLANFRAEASFRSLIFSDDTSTDGNSSVTDLDGSAAVAGADPATTRQKRDVFEGSLALKADVDLGHSTSAALGIEFFVRHTDDETVTSRPIIIRDADVEALFLGVMFVVQPEVPVTESVSLVGDFGAGFYGVDADARLATTFGIPSTIDDDEQRFGFRGRATGGLKFAVSSRVTATLFGGVEYWSDVPYANMPSPFGTDFVSDLGFDDLWEVTVGANVTIAFDNPFN